MTAKCSLLGLLLPLIFAGIASSADPAAKKAAPHDEEMGTRPYAFPVEIGGPSGKPHSAHDPS